MHPDESSPPARSQPWRYEVALDVDKVHTAGRWNSGFILVGIGLLAICVSAIWTIAATGVGSWIPYVFVGVVAAASAGLVVSSVLRRRMLLLLVGRSASACTITEHGITLAGAPEIAWGEIEFIAVLNDRPRTDRLRAIPLLGRLGELTLKAGNGSILCEIAVRDGESLRRRFDDRAAARRVTLYGRWPDGRRRGVLSLLLDAVLSETDTETTVRAALAAASAHAIPSTVHASTLANLRWKAPRLDPDWPRPAE
ncbi:hypothetical protein [Agromyces ramosus]|uniref:Uncharacterized protein n=1 Tax=Agromyces ramosus TaxID=33879 RepID=A0ABU0R595_9MICO|nr:hypothetical protein [Agromyces ramosus]MDQ0893253.1 hypothetical protein [Agromyces ramosus]